jgi:ribose transport system permease protein
MTLVMINGNIDLSVGAVVALASSLAVDLQSWSVFAAWANWAILPAGRHGLGRGHSAGALNGFIVWKTGVDAFIVTLGAMIGVRGLVFIYTREESFFAMNFAYSDFGSSSVGPLPTLAVLFLLFHRRNPPVAVAHGARAQHLCGWRQSGSGGQCRHPRRTAHDGQLHDRSGFSPPLPASRCRRRWAPRRRTSGADYELWVITATVLGGTKLTGGAGNIIGTFGGVLAIQLLRKGLGLIGAPTTKLVILGSVILIAVLFLDKQLNRKGAEELKV